MPIICENTAQMPPRREVPSLPISVPQRRLQILCWFETLTSVIQFQCCVRVL